MISSPLRPVEKMLNAVPSAPEQVSEQMAQFRKAEQYLPVGSLFSLSAQNGQHRVGQHGQRDMPVPALPMAHFVVV